MNLKDIPGIENFDKIILHSSFKKKKEQLLIKEAKELGLKTLQCSGEWKKCFFSKSFSGWSVHALYFVWLWHFPDLA